MTWYKGPQAASLNDRFTVFLKSILKQLSDIRTGNCLIFLNCMSLGLSIPFIYVGMFF